MRDNRTGPLQDHLGGAVVLFEADDLDFGEVFFEVEDVLDVSPTPAVDGLIFIADDADVVVLAGEELHELVLGLVGVLVLVDHDVLVAAVVAFAGGGGGLEEANGFEEEIVEVEGVGFEEFIAIDLEDVGDLFFHRVGACEEVLLGIDHVVLGPGDTAEGYAGLEGFIVDAEALEGRFYDGLLVGLIVDGEGAGEAFAVDLKGFNIAAQDADAEAVEGGEGGLGERGVAEDFVYALCHFLRSFVGEGDGKDVVSGDVALLDEPRDAVGDDASFAGASAGEQEDGAIDGLDALLLLGVHVF